MSGLEPAVQRSLDEIEPPVAFEDRVESDRVLFESRGGRNELERRSGRCRLLGRLVVERSGLILSQTVVVGDIHRVRKTVIVIAGISHARKDFSCLRIRDDRGAGAGIKCKHGRREDQVVDLCDDEAERIDHAAGEILVLSVRLVEYALIIENVDQKSAADPVLLQKVFVQHFAEIPVCGEIPLNIGGKLCIDL